MFSAGAEAASFKKSLNGSRLRLRNEIMESHIQALFEDLYKRLDAEDATSSTLEAETTPVKKKKEQIENIRKKLEKEKKDDSVKFLDAIYGLKHSICYQLEETLDKDRRPKDTDDQVKKIINSTLSYIKDRLQKKVNTDYVESKLDTDTSDLESINPHIDKWFLSLQKSLDEDIPTIKEQDDFNKNDIIYVKNLLIRIISHSRYALNDECKTITKHDHFPFASSEIEILFSATQKNAEKLKEYINKLEQVNGGLPGFHKSFTGFSQLLTAIMQNYPMPESFSTDLTLAEKMSVIGKTFSIYKSYARIYNIFCNGCQNKQFEKLLRLFNEEIVIPQPFIMVNEIFDKSPYFVLPSRPFNIEILLLQEAIEEWLKSDMFQLETRRALEYLNSQITRYFETEIDKSKNIVKELLFRLAFAISYVKKEGVSFKVHLEVLEKFEENIKIVLQESHFDIRKTEKGNLYFHPSYTAAKRHMEEKWIARTPKGDLLLEAKSITFPLHKTKNESQFQQKMLVRIKEVDIQIDKSEKIKDPEKFAMLYLIREALISYRDSEEKSVQEQENLQKLVTTILYVNHRFPESDGIGSHFGGVLATFGYSGRRGYWASLDRDLRTLFEEETLVTMKQDFCRYDNYKAVFDAAERHISLCHLRRECGVNVSYFHESARLSKSIDELQSSYEAYTTFTLMINIIQQESLHSKSTNIDNLASCLRHLHKLFSGYLSSVKKLGEEHFSFASTYVSPVGRLGEQPFPFTLKMDLVHKILVLFRKQYPEVWDKCASLSSSDFSKTPFYEAVLFPVFSQMYRDKFLMQLSEKWGGFNKALLEVKKKIPEQSISALKTLAPVKEQTAPDLDRKGIDFSSIKPELLQRYMILSALGEEEFKGGGSMISENNMFEKKLYLLACYLKHHPLSHMSFLKVSCLIVSYIDPLLEQYKDKLFKTKNLMFDHNDREEVNLFLLLLEKYDADKMNRFIDRISYAKEISVSREKTAMLQGKPGREIECDQANAELAIWNKKSLKNKEKIEFFKGLFENAETKPSATLTLLKEAVAPVIMLKQRLEGLEVVLQQNMLKARKERDAVEDWALHAFEKSLPLRLRAIPVASAVASKRPGTR